MNQPAATPTAHTLNRLISHAIQRHRKLHRETPALVRMSCRPFKATLSGQWQGMAFMFTWDLSLDHRHDEDGNPIDTVITVASGQSDKALKLP